MLDEDVLKIMIMMTAIMTNSEVGNIIDRGGKIVKSIRDESGAKIRIKGSSQQERIFTVYGPINLYIRPIP